MCTMLSLSMSFNLLCNLAHCWNYFSSNYASNLLYNIGWVTSFLASVSLFLKKGESGWFIREEQILLVSTSTWSVIDLGLGTCFKQCQTEYSAGFFCFWSQKTVSHNKFCIWTMRVINWRLLFFFFSILPVGEKSIGRESYLKIWRVFRWHDWNSWI